MKIAGWIVRGVFLLYLISVSTAFAQQKSATIPLQDRARLESMQQRLRVMGDDIIEFWLTHGIDEQYGGVYGTIDRTGNNIDPRTKGLIQEARHLWVFSMAYQHGRRDPAVRAAADNLYNFIIDHFHADNHQFHYTVSEDGGTVTDDRNAIYAESFAILALSQYAMTFGNKEAAQEALDCFKSCNDAYHCSEYGGFDERNDGGILSGDAVHGTNTHMHMLESTTALYNATHDPYVRQRLEELLNIFVTKIFQPGDFCYTRFNLDWSSFGDPVIEYGHDLQVSWLMLEAARALGRPDDPAVIDVSVRMSTKAARDGYDAANGGYFFSGMPDGELESKSKDWWVQCEAMNGLWWNYRLTGDSSQLDKMEETLDFIEQVNWDREYGEWFSGLRADGAMSNPERKGTFWKTGYHNGRLTVFLDRWIGDYLAMAN